MSGDDTKPRGLLGRVRRRAKRVVHRVKEGVKTLNEEAKHPGRPPSYQAAASPYWQDDDMVMPSSEASSSSAASGSAAGAAPPAASPPADDGLPKPTDRTDRDGEPFWFLQGGDDLDGWDQTNPSEQWRERHGVDGNE